MINLLDTQWKGVLLRTWKSQIMMNQRVLFGLAEEFAHIQYWDEELWLKIAETAIGKKKINNTHYFHSGYRGLCLINEQPGFEGKFTEYIDKLVNKHYTEDRKWRYSLEKRNWYTLQDLIDRREESGEPTPIMRESIDLEILEKAKQATKKLKRLKMAKYS